ncbi:hypothetical protein DUI87_13462 [Hirundo rustica rustica]|uniref:RNase H type-1 domain-containing protein n=1 Tax=Hirundo rustica rustica TaxID=333673 RepID=A0A3M0K8Z8_HIRRU|nr:hypothetical protein DUI87_13462 [Hirundo rustica rustica]
MLADREAKEAAKGEVPDKAVEAALIPDGKVLLKEQWWLRYSLWFKGTLTIRNPCGEPVRRVPLGTRTPPTIFGEQLAKDLESWEPPPGEGTVTPVCGIDLLIATRTQETCVDWTLPFLSGSTGEPVIHDCLETIEATYSSPPRSEGHPAEDAETCFTDGSSYVVSGRRHAGYAVTTSREVIESGAITN